MLLTGVAVEKVRFSQNRRDFGDRKCLPEARASLVGLPNAKFFEHFSGNEFFNSHRITLKCPAQRHDECNRDLTSIEDSARGWPNLESSPKAPQQVGFKRTEPDFDDSSSCPKRRCSRATTTAAVSCNATQTVDERNGDLSIATGQSDNQQVWRFRRM